MSCYYKLQNDLLTDYKMSSKPIIVIILVTFVGDDLVNLHLREHLDDAVLLLRVVPEGFLPQVHGDHLALVIYTKNVTFN